MEQWEKEYIETVSRSKHFREQGKGIHCAYEEGYDSSRWVEVTRDDGTKYYIPKVSTPHNRQSERQKRTTKNNRPQFGRFIKVVIGISLIIVLLYGLGLVNGQNKISRSEWAKTDRNTTLQGFIQGKLLGGTYIDGYGFLQMMQFFEEMQQERCSFLEDIAQNVYSISEIDVEQWSRIMTEREEHLSQLKYASSYQEYVDAEKEVFAQQKELLTLVKHHAEIHTVVELHNQLVTADMSLRAKVVEALEKNGIEYYVDQDVLTYQYKKY